MEGVGEGGSMCTTTTTPPPDGQITTTGSMPGVFMRGLPTIIDKHPKMLRGLTEAIFSCNSPST